MFKSYNILVPAQEPRPEIGDVLLGLTECHLRRAVLEQLKDILVGRLRGASHIYI